MSSEAENDRRYWRMDDNLAIFMRSDPSGEWEGWDGSESGPQPPENFREYGRPAGRVVEGEILEAGGGSILQRFETDNPFLQRLFAHPLYGRVPEGCKNLLDQLATAHPEERFLTALSVRHGAEPGYLMITTHFLRYVRSLKLLFLSAPKKDEMWSLALDIEAEGFGQGVIRTATGHQFQIRSWKAKQFLEFHRLAQRAMAWDSEQEEGKRQALHDAAAATTVQNAAPRTGTLVDEIRQIAQLRDEGILSEEEFAAAKARILGS